HSHATYTLSLHDALPIYKLLVMLRHRFFPLHIPMDRGRNMSGVTGLQDRQERFKRALGRGGPGLDPCAGRPEMLALSCRVGLLRDRKSTRLNSSHDQISY